MNRKNLEYRLTHDAGLELVLSREEARVYPWHFHVRHWTFGLVRNGFITIGTRDGAFSLGPGQTFAIAPLAPHKLDVHEHSSLAVLCSEGHEPVRRCALDALLQGDIEEDIRDWLLSPSVPSLFAQAPADFSPIGAACCLLTAQPDEHFSLKDLASFAGYSPWYFLRLFKKRIGFTPHAFQLICRISHVRAMLKTGVAIAEAAATAGFADQSHLHKLFKLHHGLTPKQFTKCCVIPER